MLACTVEKSLHARSTLSLHSFLSHEVSFFVSISNDEQMTRFIGNGPRWDEGTIPSGIDLALEHLPLEEAGTTRWFIATLDTDPVGLVAQPNY